MTSYQISRLVAGYISPNLPGSLDAICWREWVRYCASLPEPDSRPAGLDPSMGQGRVP